jgi:hypothetical protein
MIFLKGCFCNCCLGFQATNKVMYWEGLKYDCTSTRKVDVPVGTEIKR